MLQAEGDLCECHTCTQDTQTGLPGWNEEQGFGRYKSKAREVGQDCGGPCRSYKGFGFLAKGQ